MTLRTRTLRSSFVLSLLSAFVIVLAGMGQSAPAQTSPALRPAFSIEGGSGYWFVATDGGIFSYGPDAGFHGSAGDIPLNEPIVGMATTPFGDGYWLVATDGGIFAFGEAAGRFYGSTGDIDLNQPVVSMAPTAEGDGYYLVASDGGVFAFGSAANRFYGSLGNLTLNAPIVGMALTATGEGYYMVASDGGVFSFGDAASQYHGSLGGQGTDDIVDIVPTLSGGGYWLVGADGSVYEFGDAPFYGDMSNDDLNAPIVGMANAGFDDGYWLIGSDGGVFSFGDAPFHGSTGNLGLNAPIVGMASAPIYVVTPDAIDDQLTVSEDAPGTVNVLVNDHALDSGVSLSLEAAPANGTATCSGSTCTYTPNANFNGTDSFSYTVSDDLGFTDTATVAVTIDAINDVPAAAGDSLTVAEDGSGDVNVLANDFGLGDGGISIARTAAPANGTATCSGSTCTYTPNANLNGSDSFTYTVTDVDGESDVATVAVTVTPVDDGSPVAANDAATTSEDADATTIDVLANDTNLIDAPITVAISSPASIGETVVNDDGTIAYTPSADANGTDSLEYTITDLDGDVSTGAVAINITAVDDVVVAADDTLGINEDTAGTATVLSNDSGLGDGGIVQTIARQGTLGEAVVNSNGTITYTPAADATGTDSFDYKLVDADGDEDTAAVTVTIAPVNDVIAAVDDSITIDEDVAGTTSVLDNDTNKGDAPLDVAVATQGAKGAAVANSDGTITYTPNANANGSDSYTYSVTDANGDTDTATVTVTITPVDDGMPDAVADAYSVNEDTALSVPSSGRLVLLANDTGLVDGVTLSIVSQPAKGVLSGVGQDGSFSYTPNADVHGTDTFTYRLLDTDGQEDTAQVTLSIIPVNDTPVAVDDAATTDEDVAVVIPVVANDTGTGDGPLTLTVVAPAPTLGVATVNPDRTITYTPNAGASGTDSFGYNVRDSDGQNSTAVVSITISGVNDAPVAADDAVTTDEDVAAAPLNVLANDSDAEQAASSLTVALVSQGAKGTAVVNPDKTITYTPDADANGSDSFTYRITDDGGATDTAVITVTINAVDDIPAPVADSMTTTEDADATSVKVLDNDTGLGDGSIVLTLDAQALNGTAACSGQSCSYKPKADFAGSDDFYYRITDADGDTSTAKVSVNVTAVDDVPVAVNDATTTDEDTATTVTVLANDTDLGDTVIVSIVTDGTKGRAVANPDGTITYTPLTNVNTAGSPADVVVYRITDADGDTDTADLAVTITAISDETPVATDDAATTNEDTAVSTDVLTNDTGALDFLKVAIASAPTHGTAVVQPDRTVTYTPAANYYGSDAYRYTITDSDGETATATVTVTVNPIDDTAPVAVDDSASTNEDTAVEVAVLANDELGVDGTTLALEGVPTNGTVTCGATTCTFTPTADYSGIGRFSYRITDADAQTSVGDVEVGIVGQDDTPTSANDSATTSEDTAVSIPVLANDTNLDQPPAVTLEILSQGTKGTASYDPASQHVLYTPLPHANTAWEGVPDSFTYRLTDADGDVGNVATVSVTITAVNDFTPVLKPDTYTMSRSNGPYTFNVSENDFLHDPAKPDYPNIDHARYTVATGISPAGSGWVSCETDGTCTYSPTATAYTNVTFTYRVTDSDGQTSTARVDITVGP